jgi:alpha-glucoside transport system ATP-binding protein
VFLFDEPLSNLDAALRVATRIEIAKLKEKMADTTMIYVTHDQVEAMTLADRIVVLSAGKIEQVGAPLELYERPANLFVARFIGSPAMNILPVTIAEPGAKAILSLKGNRTAGVPIEVPSSDKDKAASLGIRPEDLTVSTGEDYLIEGRVLLVEALGEVTLLYLEGPSADEPIIAKLQGMSDIAKGDVVRLSADPAKLHLFDENGRSYRQ